MGRIVVQEITQQAGYMVGLIAALVLNPDKIDEPLVCT